MICNNCLSCPGYSYLSEAGATLRKPLFELCSAYFLSIIRQDPDEPTLLKVTKIALRTFAFFVCFIPASLVWILGKTFTCLSALRLNEENLSLVPAPVSQEELAEAEVFNGNEFFEMCYEIAPTCRESLSFERLCNGFDDPKEYWASQRENIKVDLLSFRNELRWYLWKIAEKLPSLKKEEQQSLIDRLKRASEVCAPTWLTEAKNICSEQGIRNDVRERILGFVQRYKHELTLDYVQRRADLEWHGISYVQQLVGSELGLGRNKVDPFAGEESRVFSKRVVRWFMLEKIGDVNSLITAVQHQINQNIQYQLYHEFLTAILAARGDKEAQHNAYENYFEEEDCGALGIPQVKIKREGVVLILKHLRIIH